MKMKVISLLFPVPVFLSVSAGGIRKRKYQVLLFLFMAAYLGLSEKDRNEKEDGRIDDNDRRKNM